VAQESSHGSRSVGTTPCRGGGGIGYHGLSCHGKVYEDECRIASCEVSPCEVERYGTQSDRSDAYADDSSAEQPGLIFFFWALFIGFSF
jgi:hypothetical protein